MVRDWEKKLWSAFQDHNYSLVHEQLFKEFEKLRDETQTLHINKLSMVDYVASIYDHIASQGSGYKPHIHRQPLRIAICNYCEGKPVPDWKAPADQFSRSPTPVLLPSPQPQLIESNAGPAKKRGKAKVVNLDEFQSDRDESETESAKRREREPTKRREKREPAKGRTTGRVTFPATDGMEPSPTKCTLCEKRGHVCHVNPKVTKAAACFECNHWRLKCSLTTSRAKRSEAVASESNEDEEVAASKEQTPKRRKKPTQVPAGRPGQFSRDLSADVN